MPKGNTDYAKLIQEVRIPSRHNSDHEYGIQLIVVKETGRQEVRFAYFNQGRFIPVPLDLPVDEFQVLYQKAVDAGIFK